MKRTIANMLIKLANRISPPEPSVRERFNIHVGPGFGTAEFRNEQAQADASGMLGIIYR